MKSSLFESVQFRHMNGEVLRPILLVKPKGIKLGNSLSSNCIPVHQWVHSDLRGFLQKRIMSDRTGSMARRAWQKMGLTQEYQHLITVQCLGVVGHVLGAAPSPFV